MQTITTFLVGFAFSAISYGIYFVWGVPGQLVFLGGVAGVGGWMYIRSQRKDNS